MVDCILDNERIEEILGEKWRSLKESDSRERALVQDLFIKLKDRQTITYAAFLAIDAFDRLKEGRDEVIERDKVMFERFVEWWSITMRVPGLGQGRLLPLNPLELDNNDVMEPVMNTYSKITELTRKFLRCWSGVKESDKRVISELKKLNLLLATLPRKLRRMSWEDIEGFKWPKRTSKRVSKAVEQSMSRIWYMNKIVNKIEDLVDNLETIFAGSNGKSPPVLGDSSGEMDS